MVFQNVVSLPLPVSQKIASDTWPYLKFRHTGCICKIKVKDNNIQNTTSILAGCSYGVNKTHMFWPIRRIISGLQMLALGN